MRSTRTHHASLLAVALTVLGGCSSDSSPTAGLGPAAQLSEVVLLADGRLEVRFEDSALVLFVQVWSCASSDDVCIARFEPPAVDAWRCTAAGRAGSAPVCARSGRPPPAAKGCSRCTATAASRSS